MGVKTAFKRFFDLDEEMDDKKKDETNHQNDARNLSSSRFQSEKKQNVVSLQSAHHQTKVILLEPTTFDDVESIADHLKNRRTVVVNLQRLSKEGARRILDFMSGTVFALDGNIQKLGENTFMCAPEHVDITGVISEFMERQK